MISEMQLGPGLLDIGEEGSLTSLASQVTEVELKPKTKTDDPEYVLSGEALAGEIEETWTLEGEFIQDFGVSLKSISEWMFTNRGKTMPFKFVPNKAGTKAITGKVVIAASNIGGKVKKRNKGSFEFSVIDPDLVSNTPA